MKFMHLSDLHLGIRLCGYSLTEDQRYILDRIAETVDAEKPDCVFICGDVYDKPVPSEEAVTLFHDFLLRLQTPGRDIFVIAGNHDSEERLAFSSALTDKLGIHFAPVLDGHVTPFIGNDENGEYRIYPLPFTKPMNMRRNFPDTPMETYGDMMKALIADMNVDTSKRNILLTHQYITGTEMNEDGIVGGTENIDASVFAPFDYVALGHIHKAQNCGSERVRYCGSPLKYSASEAQEDKTVTVGEITENGKLTLRLLPLMPLRDTVVLRGTYDELMARSFYENTHYKDDYVYITLTDEQDVFDAKLRLMTVYRHLMTLKYDNNRTRADNGATDIAQEVTDAMTPYTLFSELYKIQNNRELDSAAADWIRKMTESEDSAE